MVWYNNKRAFAQRCDVERDFHNRGVEKGSMKELKNKFTVTIEEVEIIKENVVFRVPKKLN